MLKNRWYKNLPSELSSVICFFHLDKFDVDFFDMWTEIKSFLNMNDFVYQVIIFFSLKYPIFAIIAYIIKIIKMSQVCLCRNFLLYLINPVMIPSSKRGLVSTNIRNKHQLKLYNTTLIYDTSNGRIFTNLLLKFLQDWLQFWIF